MCLRLAQLVRGRTDYEYCVSTDNDTKHNPVGDLFFEYSLGIYNSLSYKP